MAPLRILVCFALGFFARPLLAEDASQSARSHLDFQAEVHGGFNGAGAGLGLFLSGDYRLDLNYSERSISIFGSTAKENTYRFEIQSFLGNSFYYSLGLTQRAIQLSELEITWGQGISYGGNRRTSKIRNIGPHVLIGNEWQWDHFFIGAEWIGFMTPLSWSYSNEYAEGTDERERKTWDEDSRTVARQTSGIALNLFLGFSF